MDMSIKAENAVETSALNDILKVNYDERKYETTKEINTMGNL